MSGYGDECLAIVLIPTPLPFVAIKMAPKDSKLYRLMPRDILLLAPAFDGKIAHIGGVIAGLLMGVERIKVCLCMQTCENLSRFTGQHMQRCAYLPERHVQITKAF